MKKILIVVILVVFNINSQEVTFSSLYQDILGNIILFNDYEYESEGKKIFNKFVNFIFSSSEPSKLDENIKKLKEAIKRFIKLSLINKSFRKCICHKYLVECFLNQCAQRYGLNALENLLYSAIIKKNLKLVEFLLNSTVLNIDNMVIKNMHILMIAINTGKESIIKALIKRVTSIKSDHSFYILSMACYLMRLEIINLLIQKTKINVNSQDKHGNTVLMECVNCSRVNIVKLLLKSGADPNIRNNLEKTAIMIATHRANKIIVKMLIKHKADINLLNKDGQNLLQIASKVEDNKSLIKFFLKRLGNINVQDTKYKDTPLISSILYFTDYKTIRFLLKSGADPNIKNKDNVTALTVAIDHRYFDVIKLLLSYGAKIDGLDDCIYDQFMCGKT